MSPMLLAPRIFEDPRGWFCETFNARRAAAVGIDAQFCQDNQSLSREAGTLRGLHFQAPPSAQAKLVRCLRGAIRDVVVDIRRASPSFGMWRAVELSAKNGLQLFVPRGYAHGFVTLEEDCEVAYKVDAYYSAADERGIAWNDPALAIDWGLGARAPLLSAKDVALPGFDAFDTDFPYSGGPMDEIETFAV